MEKITIFVDGSNLFNRLKELGIAHLLNFDYSAFAESLAGSRIIAEKRYYVGQVRAERDDEKAQKLLRDQQRLFAKLESDKWIIEKGYMMRLDHKNHPIYKEKGVDVKIATDLLVGAYENSFDGALLVSSDTDLLPAIKKVGELGKFVEYVGFEHKKSWAMLNNVQRSLLLRIGDLERFSNGTDSLFKEQS